jgi:hypoxanthine phosphoribosyltransferase
MPGFPRLRRSAPSPARSLASRLAGFGAAVVVCVRRGGEPPARVIAGELGLPLFFLDVRYPFSRLLERAWAPIRPLLFLFKEPLYRLGSPASAPDAGRSLPAPGPGDRLLLVDDSASSGRTLEVALGLLAAKGWTRDRIRVAVLRCGTRARSLVDVVADRG